MHCGTKVRIKIVNSMVVIGNAVYTYSDRVVYSDKLLIEKCLLMVKLDHFISCLRRLNSTPSIKELRNRIAGAWIGKCCGCMLGKPIEGWNPNEILRRLLRIGEYPLRYYLPKNFFTDEELKVRRGLVREEIDRVVRDDDIDYMVVNLEVVKRYGLEFKPDHILKLWLELLPIDKVYTAERVAYRNYVLGLKPPFTALFMNPYKEWIGARIRADIWGWILPGLPSKAAYLAFKDAIVSHTSNGLIAAVFQAAINAYAFIERDVYQLIADILEFLPRSKLREAISYVVKLFEMGLAWIEALNRILREFRYGPVHSVNNTAIEVLALLWSKGDYDRAICIAVMCGLDTDCNGANVGSIIGTINGIDRIDRRWYEVFNDIVETGLSGYSRTRLSRLIDETYEIALKNIERT